MYIHNTYMHIFNYVYVGVCVGVYTYVCAKLLQIISNDYGAEKSDLSLARPSRENSLSFKPSIKIKRSERFSLSPQARISNAYAMVDGSELSPMLICFVLLGFLLI